MSKTKHPLETRRGKILLTLLVLSTILFFLVEAEEVEAEEVIITEEKAPYVGLVNSIEGEFIYNLSLNTEFR